MIASTMATCKHTACSLRYIASGSLEFPIPTNLYDHGTKSLAVGVKQHLLHHLSITQDLSEDTFPHPHKRVHNLR